MDERPFLGNAEPTPDFEGEGGPPVGGEETSGADDAQSGEAGGVNPPA